MKKGLSIAVFVVGIVIAACGAAITIMSTIGMSGEKKQ